ncbi:zinc ABC transporter substrate-binding protein [Corynebacterium pseudokroppenstedtii]|uniref:Zinc ABC transporter substrate-binding protein n=1 Tax=Corynebacterium pseudokroppenstedtii TaxID=2804917 RepID=A0AAU0Q0Z9_9CORY|nr:zinc ABC transporter substrate-binding protein [Corynebacterium pseudokroppenstedtii]MBY0791096.1 zinc ABC transporter substrate-binding protein [Corynebacterium pseudokroppenstedtii]MCF6793340.1 zinc ABC transporter substrate-binding protein [Corynebacterium pseudokroppenstedtii]MCF8703033.1 zinc ABC transporter substrate-binding protein [Corynebacterium pseudokroppenstedtii]MCG2636368.1 zinc ABC transporter substrate-binding protein [Corynebacterium pseudokroppenstedtii]
MRAIKNRRQSALAFIFATGLLTGMGGLTACSDDSSPTSGSSDTVNVVASTALWADVVHDIAEDNDHVKITGLIEGDSVDPHDYNPSAKDMAKIKDADVVVGNGAGYDTWLTEHASSDATVITALPQEEHDHDGDENDGHDHDADAHDAHDHESEDAHDHDANNDSDLPTNPHVWYDVATVNSFATKIADTLNDKNGDIKASTKDFSDKLHAIDEKIKALPAKKVASTESVSGYLLKESPMEDVTPHGYLSASLKESDPSAADVAEFTSLINDKKVDILVNNPQTEDSVSKDLVSAAKKAGIPVVDIYETPEKGTHYLDFFSEAVQRLHDASKE